MSEEADSREDRRRGRSSWPVHRYLLGHEPGDDLSATTTPQQRLAMVWELTLRAYRLADRPLPRYARSEMPGRILRPQR
jgi:hypothetical protein